MTSSFGDSCLSLRPALRAYKVNSASSMKSSSVIFWKGGVSNVLESAGRPGCGSRERGAAGGSFHLRSAALARRAAPATGGRDATGLVLYLGGVPEAGDRRDLPDVVVLRRPDGRDTRTRELCLDRHARRAGGHAARCGRR